MLSGMENYGETLHAADLAAAAPFTQTPRTPAWYPFTIATYLTTIFGAFLLVQEGRIIMGAGLSLLSVAVMLVMTFAVRSQWGTWPRMSAAPDEIKRAFGLYLLLAVAAIVISVSAWLWLGPLGGLITLFLTTLVVVWAYEFRLYPAAARQVRQRLA